MRNKKIFKNNLLAFYLIPFLFFFVLVLAYLSIQKNLSVSYYDEMLWTGRSYFFDYFIKKDFKNNIWKSPESSDQPKLGEYLYGAWLYKDYLQDKINDPELNYPKFLIKNGLYMINKEFDNSYDNFHNQYLFKISQFQETDDGNSNYYRQKYGLKSLKTINLIYKAREVNVFLLAGAVIAGYYIFIVLNGNVISALIFSLIYGFNNLLINTSLKAHSEALFILFFNLSLLNMFLYFIKKNQFKYLLLFSIFTGLCASTKLNGFMFLIIFALTNLWHTKFNSVKKNQLRSFILMFVPIIISLLIFYILNPFIYNNPINKIQYMFISRFKTAIRQSYFFHSFLVSPKIRIEQIFSNFFHPNNISEFQSVYFLNINPKHWIVVVIVFFMGIFVELKNIIRNYVKSFIFAFSFIATLTIMSCYLLLNWDRYYIQLILFFDFYKIVGIVSIFYFIARKVSRFSLFH